MDISHTTVEISSLNNGWSAPLGESWPCTAQKLRGETSYIISSRTLVVVIAFFFFLLFFFFPTQSQKLNYSQGFNTPLKLQAIWRPSYDLFRSCSTTFPTGKHFYLRIPGSRGTWTGWRTEPMRT